VATAGVLTGALAWGRRAQDESSVTASRAGRVTRERRGVIAKKKAAKERPGGKVTKARDNGAPAWW